MIRLARVYRQPHVGRMAACLFPKMQADLYTATGGNTSGASGSYRSLRDGPDFARIPGNKLPGYDHSVPTGQVQPAIVWKVGPKRSRLTPTLHHSNTPHSITHTTPSLL